MYYLLSLCSRNREEGTREKVINCDRNRQHHVESFTNKEASSWKPRDTMEEKIGSLERVFCNDKSFLFLSGKCSQHEAHCLVVYSAHSFCPILWNNTSPSQTVLSTHFFFPECRASQSCGVVLQFPGELRCRGAEQTNIFYLYQNHIL